VGRRDLWEREARPARQLEVRRGLSATAVRPGLLTVVHPDPRRVLRPVLLWVTEVRLVLGTVTRLALPAPEVRPVLGQVKRPARPVPEFPLPARSAFPERRRATADAAASSAA
jgi:hypothetical protein